MVINTKDLRYLLILDDYDMLPEYDTEQLTGVWYDIYDEFSGSVGDHRSSLWIGKQARRAANELQLAIGQMVLSMVQMFPCQKTVEIAAEHGFEIDLEHFKESFEKQKSKVSRLENKLRFAKADEQQKQQAAPDNNIDSLIVSLQRFQGYQFNQKEMSVMEFAGVYRQYKDHVKASK